MFTRLQHHVVPITIVVAFYVFGFFVMVHALGLTDPQIVAGLASGAIGGLTTLVAILRAEANAAQPSRLGPEIANY